MWKKANYGDDIQLILRRESKRQREENKKKSIVYQNNSRAKELRENKEILIQQIKNLEMEIEVKKRQLDELKQNEELKNWDENLRLRKEIVVKSAQCETEYKQYQEAKRECESGLEYYKQVTPEEKQFLELMNELEKAKFHHEKMVKNKQKCYQEQQYCAENFNRFKSKIRSRQDFEKKWEQWQTRNIPVSSLSLVQENVLPERGQDEDDEDEEDINIVDF